MRPSMFSLISIHMTKVTRMIWTTQESLSFGFETRKDAHQPANFDLACVPRNLGQIFGQ